MKQTVRKNYKRKTKTRIGEPTCFVVVHDPWLHEEEEVLLVIELKGLVKGSQISAHQITTLTTDTHTHRGGLQKVVVFFCCALFHLVDPLLFVGKLEKVTRRRSGSSCGRSSSGEITFLLL